MKEARLEKDEQEGRNINNAHCASNTNQISENANNPGMKIKEHCAKKIKED